MKYKKAVLIKIADTHFDKKYLDELNLLFENKVSLDRDDPNLLAELKDCDCLLLGFQVPIGKEIFDAAPDLKLINILATAYGTVDLSEASKRGIPVCNLAGYSTEAVAEFSIAAILYVLRQLEEGRKRAKSGDYSFKGMSARELKNSNFGVVGLGNIGLRVAELASGFGANVSYWSRNKKNVDFNYMELNDLLKSSDYISINVAEAPETTNLLNKDNIPLIKTNSIVISTVPPPVIDADALSERLDKNDMTFIFDHPDEMEGPELNKLIKHENCIVFGPIGFITEEARIAKQEIFIKNIKAALSGKPQNTVS